MNIKTLSGKMGVTASMGALLLIACMGGTGEGNPEFGTLSVSLRARADSSAPLPRSGPGAGALAKKAANDTLRLFDEGRTPYAIHHIYAHVDRVEIARPQGADCRGNDSVACTDSTVVVSGSRFLDLLEKPSPLILKDLRLPAGVYNRMKIRFSKLVDHGDGRIPAPYLPLVGHAILMKGTFAYGGVPDRPLTIFLDFDDLFAFENAAGLAITADSPYNWAGIFLASRWLGNLEITECLNEHKIALQPDGGIIIDSGTECNEIEDSLIENVRHSTVFERDDD